MHDVFIFHQPSTDTYWIDHSTDASASTVSTPNTKALYEEIKRYVLRSKVKLKYATEEYDVWSVYGTPANETQSAARWWKFGSGGAAEPQWEFQDEAWKEVQRGLREGEVGCWDLRGGWGQEGMGRRLLVKKGESRKLRQPERSGDMKLESCYLTWLVFSTLELGSRYREKQ